MSPRKPFASSDYEERRLRILAEEASGSILDLGHAAMPNSFLPATQVTGLDLEAPITASGYAQDRVGSVMELDTLFPEQRFDTVIAGELIEHLEEPYEFLRQVRSVLAPDGRLVLSTPNPLGFPVIFFEMAWSRRFFYTRNHVYYFLPRWVERVFDLTGFELERVRVVGLWLPWRSLPWCPRWMSYQLVYVGRPRRT